MSTVLQLERVSLRAQGNGDPILQDLSLTINEGDRIAIVGPSGSGKTHLLRLLNRLSEANSGTVRYRGQAIASMPVRQLRQNVVLVLQESRLLGQTVQETLAYPLELQDLSKDAIQQRMMTWLERLHFPMEWMSAREGELSVGQRQWVAIARGLMTEPDVLLLDEPTAALDVGRGESLIHLLQNTTLPKPTTILMVTHQLDLAKLFCSRMLYIKRGQIASDKSGKDTDWQFIHQDLLETERKEAEHWDDPDWS
ncbi:MAG: ATP-binding cassette domain-containing protein [Cyanobacteria bacterium J06638_20]